jgi:signal transduction histidine kinase
MSRDTPRLPSMGRRLANALLGWTLLWGLGVALAVGLAAQHEVDELLDESLQSTAQVMGRTLGPTDFAAADDVEALPLPATEEGEFAWQLVSSDGRVLRRAANAPAEPLQSSPQAGFASEGGWRIYGTALGGNGRMLYVAHTLRERSEAQFEVAINAALAALSIGVLGHVWLRLRVRRELEPLQTLSERLQAYDPLAGSPLLGAAERAELTPVHAAIDALGRRLADRVAQERALAAHAAHALRTPLAGMDAQLAVAMREVAPEHQPRLQRVRDASTRLQRVVGSLLEMFRAGGEAKRQRVVLAELVAHLPVAGLSVQSQPEGAALDADPDLLAAALANLLDNAQRHGATHATVALIGAQRLRVSDDGPGADAARLQALRDALASRQDGEPLGLGLLLAGAVARAHGGALTLPAVPRGFVVELDLAPS